MSRRHTDPNRSTYRRSLAWTAFDRAMHALDYKFRWYRLPKPLGLLALIGIRNIMRQNNLYDTTAQPAVSPAQPQPYQSSYLTERSPDGSWNDLQNPAMGMAYTRFGRNVPIDSTWPDAELMLEPNPRVVSTRLMTRDDLVPATAGNALIAAWLQFMIRDWFKHGPSPTDNPWQLPVTADDPWPDKTVTILRSMPDPTGPPSSDLPPTHINILTHWWDGSQVYGGSMKEQDMLRSHEEGKLIIIDGLQPHSTDPAHDPTLAPGFWLGIAMLQTIFALEHNAICDRLVAAYPNWDDETVFQRARLINAALLAKIHTIEWTPAVTAHPTAVAGLHANWYGLAGQRLHNVFGRIGPSEALWGIPGSPTDQYGVPYALTEEFVAVYRMHPLIPDLFEFRAHNDDHPTLGTLEFDALTGPPGAAMMRNNPLYDLVYTFGTMNPGAVTLHNYPKHLQMFRRPDNGQLMDLAATDILRSRELGVPRYAEFRRLLGLPVPKAFADITSNKAWADELADVYGGQLERVDLISGMFAEDRPDGFAFSDTAFRIFILMASRRLNSDRFFTRDFTPQVYTVEGLRWIEDNTMSSVLLRHCPQLRPQLGAVTNAFALWPGAKK
jgi:hypothetical protein